jgi:excinuclease ABC subunit A
MPSSPDPYVRARGAREHNLKGVDVDLPRDVLTVFTGVSGRWRGRPGALRRRI